MANHKPKPKPKPKPPEKKVPAVLLAAGTGAPESWHTVVGLPGHYHPTIAAPVGGPGEIPVELVQGFLAAHETSVASAYEAWNTFRAERLEDGLPDPGEWTDPPCPIELVEISEAEAIAAREQLADLERVARRELRAAGKRKEGDEPHVASQQAAMSGTTEPTKTAATGGQET